MVNVLYEYSIVIFNFVNKQGNKETRRIRVHCSSI